MNRKPSKAQERGASSVRTLSDETARVAVEERRRGRPVKLLAKDCGTIELPSTWDMTAIDRVCASIRKLCDTLVENGDKVDAFGFDRHACSLLHNELQLPPEVAASDGFWRWLAVEKLPGVIEARHGDPQRGKQANLISYGIGTRDIGQSRLGILWLRANILYDPHVEPQEAYHLAERFLHTDFIESGIIRVRYGWCRNLARALTRFQYPDPKTTKTYLRNTGDRSIRELYKRLRHLHSVYAFEFLSDDVLRSLLENHSRDLKRA